MNEKSPYLLQHAYNPVNWYPWGEEAFTKAKAENKPIFLSIGYSTCHWCHVMETESFEDDEVAKKLNSNYVAIKVDKEERPDIDSIYMSVCQTLTGQGGWPLTILMTAEQKPFFAGTYFPKHKRYGTYGLIDLLDSVAKRWKEDKQGFIASADKITSIIKSEETDYRAGSISKHLLHQSKQYFSESFDETYGGIGKAPKFPTPHNLMFLLRYSHFENDGDALNMAEKTLQQMYRGGLFDHIGGGFSRYSTDKKWLVPHFEKMLYDNAMLTIAYLEAYQITKKQLYRDVAEKIMRYILNELTDKNGGFYSAQDADSDGEEGKYYVFSPNEIIELLGNDDGQFFNEYFDITHQGNFEGKSIPNLLDNGGFDVRNKTIDKLCETVREYRQNRYQLYKDDKILTSWNGLMIAAFAKAYQILGDKKYLDASKKANDFISNKLTTENNRLYVRYRDGEAAVTGNIDDYAFYIWGLIELHQATFDDAYLQSAKEYTNSMLTQFYDENNSGFYFCSNESESLIIKQKELSDNAIPSGNSVAAYVLVKLSRLTGDSELSRIAYKQLGYIAGNINGHHPAGFCFALCAFMLEIYSSREIACIFNKEEQKEQVLKVLSEKFMPNTVAVLKNMSESELENEYAKHSKDKNGEALFYICEKQRCIPPFWGIEELVNRL